MRRTALVLLLGLALALTAAACGGGDGAETGASDTGTSAATTGDTTTTPPTTSGADALQVPVPKGGQPIGPQSPEKQVVQVQKAMALLGYKVGKPDGVYGQKTLNAVRRFQRRQKLVADGLVGAKTARAINRALRQANDEATP